MPRAILFQHKQRRFPEHVLAPGLRGNRRRAPAAAAAATGILVAVAVAATTGDGACLAAVVGRD